MHLLCLQMCACVFDGDLVMLRRMLRAGADPNAADYDKRCALHIAAVEGNLTAVGNRMLGRLGGSCCTADDPLAAFMESCTQDGTDPLRQQLAHHSACRPPPFS